MKDLKLTVITPTFNRAHTLPRAYDSLKNQSFKAFKWIILDDGSVDATKELVEKMQEESPFEIDYYYNTNQHKFHTVFQGIKKVATPYFIILDSDDSYPKDAFEILLDEAEKIENQEEFISVMGLSGDENGEIVGDPYPVEFDGSVFEMRYQYRVKGDKNGVFFTKSYLNELEKFDYSSIPTGIYIPQSVFFNTYDAEGLKTRFINKIIRTYHKDENDEASVSNTRWSGKNRYGLMLGYQSFLNNYERKLLKYPKTLIRNIVGYQLYAILNKKSLKEINRGLEKFQFLSCLMFPFSWMYAKIKSR